MDAAAGGRVAAFVLVVEAGASLFAAFNPSWFTTRSDFFHDQKSRAGNIRAMRHGETAATILTLATGWASSTLVDSWLPMAGAVVICAVMIGGYEYSMRHPAAEVPDPDRPPWFDALEWGGAK